MKRVPEPELMTERDQAQAYAQADFKDAHSRMVHLFADVFPAAPMDGCALDLGCGPGDIACRFARAYPGLRVDGIDASSAMLEAGSAVLARYPDAAGRVQLGYGLLPDCTFPREGYDVVLSNSLLHHLADPQVLWQSIDRAGGPGTYVFVMDLLRPNDDGELNRLVEDYSAGEPSVLQRDFANSLRAAYRVSEIEVQLEATSLTLSVRPVTDRHLAVFGRM